MAIKTFKLIFNVKLTKLIFLIYRTCNSSDMSLAQMDRWDDIHVVIDNLEVTEGLL